MIKYPQATDYHQAIQNPKVAFSDPVLKACEPLTNIKGMPIVNSGGFALTYFLNEPSGNPWVVRCFKVDVPDRRERYAAIDRFLNRNRSPIFTSVTYLDPGILVNGSRYPVVKMPRVKGLPLHRYIEEQITARKKVDLGAKFEQLASTLQQLGIAHGDLQHGNIMVDNGDMVLIDYDGMYLPQLASRGSPEMGHRSYQHPLRSSQYGPDLDHFSTIVIYLALRAVTIKPELWRKYSNGDNLLFRDQDFTSPQSSPLLKELSKLPDFDKLVSTFRNVCAGGFDTIPELVDFKSQLPGPLPPVPPILWRPTVPIVAATDRQELLQQEGDQIVVVGQITDVTIQPMHGRRRAFLNFGEWRQGCFMLVVWPEVYRMFEQQNRSLLDYKGSWVSVSGLLGTYDPGSRPRHPQMVIELPTAIEVITEAEAKRRLKPAPPLPPTIGPKLSLETHVLDFGDILAGQKASLDVVLANIGSNTLHGRLSPPDRSLSTSPQTFTRSAGVRRKVTVTLDSSLATEIKSRRPGPHAQLVQYSRRVSVQSDGGDHEITVRANVVIPAVPPPPPPPPPSVPRLVVSAHVVDFGDILAGTQASRDVLVENAGGGTLQVKVNVPDMSLSVSAQQLSIRGAGKRPVTVTLHSSLAAEARSNVLVHYGRMVSYSRRVSIQSDGGDHVVTVRANLVFPALPPPPPPPPPKPKRKASRIVLPIVFVLVGLAIATIMCRNLGQTGVLPALVATPTQEQNQNQSLGGATATPPAQPSATPGRASTNTPSPRPSTTPGPVVTRTPRPRPSPTATLPRGGVGVTVTTAQEANLRRGPGLGYEIVRTVPSGTSLRLVGYGFTSDGYRWFKTVSGDWIYSSLLTTTPTGLPEVATPTPVADATVPAPPLVIFNGDPRESSGFCDGGFRSDCNFSGCGGGQRLVWGPYCRARDHIYIREPGTYRVTVSGAGTVTAGATDYGPNEELFAFGSRRLSLPGTYTFCWPGLASDGFGFETIIEGVDGQARVDRIMIEYIGTRCN